jgi:hypothetical protein
MILAGYKQAFGVCGNTVGIDDKKHVLVRQIECIISGNLIELNILLLCVRIPQRGVLWEPK